MKILLATNNVKKRRELERILAAEDLEVVLPKELGIDLQPVESGNTFEENCLIKAKEFAARTDLPVLADDSGLVVDALGGRPGVLSARYAGPHADDAQNRVKLLEDLRGVPEEQRRARFVCALAVMQQGRLLAQVGGTCEGRILEAERGTGGFGYDPVFFHPPTGKTFAELDPAEKDVYSHRGVALRRLSEVLHHIRM